MKKHKKTPLLIISVLIFLILLMVYLKNTLIKTSHNEPTRFTENSSQKSINIVTKSNSTSQTPAAGVCDETENASVTIQITQTPDNIPSPRCIAVKDGQQLSFQNNTEKKITIDFASTVFIINPHETVTINQTVEEFLSLGVYIVSTEPSIQMPEIWFRE